MSINDSPFETVFSEITDISNGQVSFMEDVFADSDFLSQIDTIVNTEIRKPHLRIFRGEDSDG